MADETPSRTGDRDAAPLADRTAADSLVRSWRMSDRAAGWWRERPSWKRITVAVLVVIAGYYAVTLAQVTRVGRDHESGPADAIVVLGAAQYDGRPSPQLAARLDHVVTLWERGVAPWVVVTGGKQPGDRFTEAEASRRYLEERGVPPESILDELAGRTTFESLDATAAMLLDRGMDRVALVTDPYHAYRSRLIAEQLGLDADPASTPTSVVGGWSSARRHLEEAAGVALGRLVGFDRLSRLAG